MCVPCSDVVAQCSEELKSGIGVEFFGRCHLGKWGLNLGPVA
jgi:hypothetical protein